MNIDSPQVISFTSSPFQSETEITGHIVAHLNVSVSRKARRPYSFGHRSVSVPPAHLSIWERDIFTPGRQASLRLLPRVFLRVSLRKTNPEHPFHYPWLPYRGYLSSDVLPVIPNEVYAVDVELWPTNVVLRPESS